MLGLLSYLLFFAVVGVAMRLASGGRRHERDNAAAAMLGTSTRLF